MSNNPVKALVLTGFGMNCDYETQFALSKAGAVADRVHVNQLIEMNQSGGGLSDYHVLAVGGGFSWADDHGAGVLLGLKLRTRLGDQIESFIRQGKLVIGICNGFQALVNMGLLPGFDGDYRSRRVALVANDCGNFRDDWIRLCVDPDSPCVFTKGIERIDLPIRHGEGKLYAPDDVLDRLRANGQIALRYAAAKPVLSGGSTDCPPANRAFPANPNGALDDIAGLCDPTGRIFGLMPHPEAFNHLTNHPDWTRHVDQAEREDKPIENWDGFGMRLFRNAVEFAINNLME